MSTFNDPKTVLFFVQYIIILCYQSWPNRL